MPMADSYSDNVNEQSINMSKTFCKGLLKKKNSMYLPGRSGKDSRAVPVVAGRSI